MLCVTANIDTRYTGKEVHFPERTDKLIHDLHSNEEQRIFWTLCMLHYETVSRKDT